MEDVKRILVVSRDTKYCKEAIHYGVSLSRKYGAELYVIHNEEIIRKMPCSILMVKKEPGPEELPA